MDRYRPSTTKLPDRCSCLLSGHGSQHRFHRATPNRVCFCTSSWSSSSSTQYIFYSCSSTRFDLITTLSTLPQQWYNSTIKHNQNLGSLHILITINQIRANPDFFTKLLLTTLYLDLRLSIKNFIPNQHVGRLVIS